MRMEEEEGPKQILQKALRVNEKGENVIDKGRLREYEKERLKYFYAVITLDNKYTAEKIYDSFDGMEIEMTGSNLDLRFLPEGLKIPKDCWEECHELGVEERKKIPNFINKAQGHTDVELTWDKEEGAGTEILYKKELD